MYLITDKNSNTIFAYGKKLEYQSNGYPLLVEEKMAFNIDIVNVHEVETVPAEVIPEKYCYTAEQGFYLNPDYVEPDPTNTYGIPDETYHAIIDDYTEELFGGEA